MSYAVDSRPYTDVQPGLTIIHSLLLNMPVSHKLEFTAYGSSAMRHTRRYQRNYPSAAYSLLIRPQTITLPMFWAEFKQHGYTTGPTFQLLRV